MVISPRGFQSLNGALQLIHTSSGRPHQGLRDVGLTYRYIRDYVEQLISTISSVLTKKTKKAMKQVDSPPKLSESDTRRLVRASAKEQAKSAKMKADIELTCSARSVRRVLSRRDFLQY